MLNYIPLSHLGLKLMAFKSKLYNHLSMHCLVGNEIKFHFVSFQFIDFLKLWAVDLENFFKIVVVWTYFQNVSKQRNNV